MGPVTEGRGALQVEKKRNQMTNGKRSRGSSKLLYHTQQKWMECLDRYESPKKKSQGGG